MAFVLAHRLADVNEEDEMTTMFGVFEGALSRALPATLADLVAVRMRVLAPTAAHAAHPTVQIEQPSGGC